MMGWGTITVKWDVTGQDELDRTKQGPDADDKTQ